MAEREYFVGPKDVTEEYLVRARAAPRQFAVVAVPWLVFSMLMAPLGTGMQLFCAIALVIIIVGFYPSIFKDRRKVVAALKKGAITKRFRMDDAVLEEIVASDVDESLVVQRTTVRLRDLAAISVRRYEVQLFSVGREDFGNLDVQNGDFVNDDARGEFIREILAFIKGPSSDDGLDVKYDPLIPKY